MKPKTRKRLTVDTYERRQITFRLGQNVTDRTLDGEGRRQYRCCVIEALVDDGAYVLDTEGVLRQRWFVRYHDLRPSGDGRRYA